MGMIDPRRWADLNPSLVIYTYYWFFYYHYLLLSGAAVPFTVQKEGAATAEEHLLQRELNAVIER